MLQLAQDLDSLREAAHDRSQHSGADAAASQHALDTVNARLASIDEELARVRQIARGAPHLHVCAAAAAAALGLSECHPLHAHTVASTFHIAVCAQSHSLFMMTAPCVHKTVCACSGG